MYAVNTMNDVIRVGDKYYTCYQAAWFVAPAPAGVGLADTVPAVIYTIPPASPLYRVTYVRVRRADVVVYGYTAVHEWVIVSAGVIVYGTGYYYPPVIWPGPIPIYYPYPYSYSGSTWYNPNTGAMGARRTVYGPYGGAVSGGSAYQPDTGAWRTGAQLGPNGGAGAWSAYNPSTGGYAHGSASGDEQRHGQCELVQRATGISGSTNQNYNQYGAGAPARSAARTDGHTAAFRAMRKGTAGSFQSSTARRAQVSRVPAATNGRRGQGLRARRLRGPMATCTSAPPTAGRNTTTAHGSGADDDQSKTVLNRTCPADRQSGGTQEICRDRRANRAGTQGNLRDRPRQSGGTQASSGATQQPRAAPEPGAAAPSAPEGSVRVARGCCVAPDRLPCVPPDWRV